MAKSRESFSRPEEIEEPSEKQSEDFVDLFLDQKPKDLEMSKLRGERLRESPSFRTFATILRRNPDTFGPLKQILARRSEFMEKSAREGESHRNLTALFAGINLSERTAGLFDEVIERDVSEKSDFYKEEIRKGDDYSPTLVVGTGPQAGAFSMEYTALNPEERPLLFDQNTRIGGQFAQATRPVFKMNSRVRPANYAFNSIPGTEGNINPLGRAVLELSDISGQAYADQSKISQAVRTNHFIGSSIVSEMKAERVLYISADRRLVVESSDSKSGEDFVTRHDRVVLTTGAGKEKSGLNENDRTTAAILEAESARFELTGEAQVLTFSQFLKLLGDKDRPFPLQGFENVIVSGPGDGGRVVAGALLGYEMSVGKSVTQLDWVKKVSWVGQQALSKEQFLEKERQRYAQLGLEFPREASEEYFHRIFPTDARGTRIERVDGKVRLYYENEEGEEIGYTEGDHLILANGFGEDTKEFVASLFGGLDRVPEPEYVYDPLDVQVPIAAKYPGIEVYIAGPAARLPLTEEERMKSPAFRIIPENSAALFRYIDYTQKLARLLALKDKIIKKNGREKPNLAAMKPERKINVLPRFSPKNEFGEGDIDSAYTRYALLPKNRLSGATTSEDYLKFVVGESLYDFEFPKALKSLAIKITTSSFSRDFSAVRLETNPPLPAGYDDVIDSLINDKLFEKLIDQFTDPSQTSKREVIITIPIDPANGSVDVANIAWSNPVSGGTSAKRRKGQRGMPPRR